LPSFQVALVATPFDQLMVATPEVRNLTVHVKKSRFVAVIFHVVFTSDDIVCFFLFPTHKAFRNLRPYSKCFYKQTRLLKWLSGSTCKSF